MAKKKAKETAKKVKKAVKVRDLRADKKARDVKGGVLSFSFGESQASSSS